MSTVHSYARFSDPKQAEGDSERRQTELRNIWLARHPEHHLSDLQLIDKGKSGYRGNKQKALQQFLKAIDEGRVNPGNILLVESVDRLSRKGIRETQTLVNSLLNKGIDIAILTPIEKVYHAQDTNDIGGAIELAAFAYVARVYSEVLGSRVRNWFIQARRKSSVISQKLDYSSTIGALVAPVNTGY